MIRREYIQIMIRFCRVVAFILLIVLLLTLLVALLYDFTVFMPNLASIRKIMDEANDEYRSLPPDTLKIIKESAEIDQIDLYIANRMLVILRKAKGKLTNWPLEYLAWYYLIKFHFNEKERIILWCIIVPYQKGYGLNNSAKYHYKKSISNLNVKELIKLIASIKTPRGINNRQQEIENETNKLFDLLIKKGVIQGSE